MAKDNVNYKRIDLKRKVFHKGGSNNRPFKRFKKTPKFIKDNIENQIAREKAKNDDPFAFTDSEDERAEELGMGLELSDLPSLLQESSANPKEVIALTQDSVRPLYMSEGDFDQSKIYDALAELKYSTFRPNQYETIKRILYGRSTLFISPTGSGKSLCYQLPALLYWRYRRYMTIVVSPLISLMEDQKFNFPSSLNAVSLHSNNNKQQREKAIAQLVSGEAQVVFVSPEAIVGGALELEDLRNLPPVGFVCIDEAHCLSEWSHNFRPAYLQFFSILREQLNIKTFLGLTATSSRATSFEISRCLVINPDTDVIGATVVPENLILSVSHESNKEIALIELLRSPTFKILPSLIVYCNSRETTEKVASLIRTSMQNYSTYIEVPERTKRGELSEAHSNDQSPNKGHMKLTWNAEAYHAGLYQDARKRIQKQFIKGEIRVVVATIAFGMGINKANIRAIIHYDMPGSFESYVQEVGRAGRDGKTAQCHMFLRADMSDMFYQQRHIYSSVVEQKNLRKLIDYMFKPCKCITLFKFKQDELNKLERKNQNDVHEIRSFQKSTFTNVPIEGDDDDLDETEISQTERTRFARKSLVRKHRVCLNSHEVAFSIDKATEKINLSPESIITFICQIQKVYPQLKIKQFAPCKSICRVICYKGAKQMEQLKLKCPVINNVIQTMKKQAAGTIFEMPSEIKFNMADVATLMGKSLTDIIRTVKKHEWDLVKETGRFRRSQIRIKFEENSFHFSTVGDLNEEEKNELHEFIADYMKKYEITERNKILNMYKTFKRNSISVDKMKDKFTRMTTSIEVKKSIDTYFNPPNNQSEISSVQLSEERCASVDDLDIQMPASLRSSISKNARDFISYHGIQHTPLSIAKIFQGISCPIYPAQEWGKNRNWWRLYSNVDFLKLLEIIKEEYMLQKHK